MPSKEEIIKIEPNLGTIKILELVARGLNDAATNTGFEALKSVNYQLRKVRFPDGTHPKIDLGGPQDQLDFVE